MEILNMTDLADVPSNDDLIPPDGWTDEREDALYGLCSTIVSKFINIDSSYVVWSQ